MASHKGGYSMVFLMNLLLLFVIVVAVVLLIVGTLAIIVGIPILIIWLSHKYLDKHYDRGGNNE